MTENQGAPSGAPLTTVVFLVDYRTGDLNTAKHWAALDAKRLFEQDEVDGLSVDAYPPGSKIVHPTVFHPRTALPITAAYLASDEDL